MTTLQPLSGVFSGLRCPAWPRIAATLASIALLIAFQQVVLAGVRQGDARRQAVAMHADAQWRCRALRRPSARVDCLLQLDASPSKGAELPAEHTAAMGEVWP